MRFASRSTLPPNPIVTLSDKIATMPKGKRELIPLQQGDLSMITPTPISDAAHKALLEGYTKYAPAAGYPQLRDALARKLSEYNKVEYDPATQILVTQGSTEALYVAVNTLLEPGDEVVLPAPYYPPYDSLIRASGGVPVYVDSSEEQGWMAPPEKVEAAVSEKTRIILINTPNNPTGEVYSREYLKAVGTIAAERDLVLLSDEAYEGLVYDGAKHISPASIEAINPNVVGMYSFSKTFAMTGWRLGYLTGSAEFIRRASTIHNLVVAHVSSPVQMGGLHALSGWNEFSGPILKELDKRRRTLVNELNKLDGVKCALPPGTFYTFPDFRQAAPNLTSQQLGDRLIEAGVGTSPGSFFGKCAEGYQRLSYSKVDEPQIVEAVARMRSVLDGIRA